MGNVCRYQHAQGLLVKVHRSGGSVFRQASHLMNREKIEIEGNDSI